MIFYNSQSRKKEVFKPIDKKLITLYTCGPTVYDSPHIGNYRTFLFEDLLKRTLIASGFKVEHAMNITDIVLTGGAIITWWVVPIMLFVGFITPWPYNYWRLKKYNIACH